MLSLHDRPPFTIPPTRLRRATSLYTREAETKGLPQSENRFETGPFCIQTFIIVEAKVNSTVREAASTRVVMMGLAIRAGSR